MLGVSVGGHGRFYVRGIVRGEGGRIRKVKKEGKARQGESAASIGTGIGIGVQ